MSSSHAVFVIFKFHYFFFLSFKVLKHAHNFICDIKSLCRFWTIEPIALNKPCASGLTRKITIYRFYCVSLQPLYLFLLILLLGNEQYEMKYTRTFDLKTSFQRRNCKKHTKLVNWSHFKFQTSKNKYAAFSYCMNEVKFPFLLMLAMNECKKNSIFIFSQHNVGGKNKNNWINISRVYVSNDQ